MVLNVENMLIIASIVARLHAPVPSTRSSLARLPAAFECSQLQNFAEQSSVATVVFPSHNGLDCLFMLNLLNY